MAIAAIKLKIMPESIEIDLNELKGRINEKLSALGAKNVSFSEENIAFGLKALIAMMAWPEEKDTSILESDLTDMEGVSSSQIIDYRRAFG